MDGLNLNRLCYILPADIDDFVHTAGHDKHKALPLTKPRLGRQLAALSRRLLPCCCCRYRRKLRRIRSPWRYILEQSQKKNKQFRQEQPFHDMAGTLATEKLLRGNPRIFSYAELYIGTRGFSQSELLGSGGFGRVYRAVLPGDGSVVAVKCVVDKEDRHEKTFAAELTAVAQLRHRNLVRLRGWCVNDGELLLVYDYMPNRSLDRVLFRGGAAAAASAPLSWDRRQRIVSGLAAALFYLHEQLETQIIHRDVKASNVMLDSDYNARLGDFGLARWLEHEFEAATPVSPPRTLPRSASSVGSHRFWLAETTRIGGTIGYLPPESFRQRSATTAKSDVFSFGIVVLEVATGRRAVDLTYPEEQIILLDWVRRLSDRAGLLQAGDSRLPDGSYNLADMRRLLHLGLLCSLNDPKSRPTMKWAMENLSQSAGELPSLPSFDALPRYISLSTSASSKEAAATMMNFVATDSSRSSYVTAPLGSTMFATANDGSRGRSSGASNDSSCAGAAAAAANFVSIDTPREIPFEEILAATDNFSQERMVAEMDFGTAYRGYLNGRLRVLVKRLGMKTCPALRARFSNELQKLGDLRHRNLVQLRGWCTEQGEMLVVYDHLQHRSLGRCLFHPCERGAPFLEWHHRYGIIKSLASAILYLHEEWDEQIIHRNITSSAIFLDSEMSPRLGSFALAEFLTRNSHGHHVVPNPHQHSARGIFGYMSPEYIESGRVTPMADVYSFGVVVLEVVTGSRAVDFRCPRVLLVEKIRDVEARHGALEELVDRRLDGNYDREELMRLLRLGLACTHSDPELRPTMKQIVSLLDGKDGWLYRSSWKGKSSSPSPSSSSSSSSSDLIKRIKALGIY